jgi:hypothetical protein
MTIRSPWWWVNRILLAWNGWNFYVACHHGYDGLAMLALVSCFGMIMTIGLQESLRVNLEEAKQRLQFEGSIRTRFV